MKTKKEIKDEVELLLVDYITIPSFKRTLPEWIMTTNLILALEWVLGEIDSLPHPTKKGN